MTADDSGVLALPDYLTLAVARKHAYVTRRTKGRFILFPTWFGKGGNIEGYLYSPDQALEPQQDVTVVRPLPRGVGEGSIPVLADLGDGWYQVYYGLD